MAKKTAKRKGATKSAGNRTGYIVTAVVLVLLIAAAVWFSMHVRPVVPERVPAAPDTTRIEQPVRKPVRDTTPRFRPDTVPARPEPAVPKPDTAARPPAAVQPAARPKPAVPNAYVLVVPKIGDRDRLLTNTDGRFLTFYDPENRVPEWTAYVLTRREAQAKATDRTGKFARDKEVARKGWASADDADYKRSGYDRGHLVPSADRDDSQRENRATFLYSNIAPQKAHMNRYSWKDLEEQVRRWAVMYDSLCIVTGVVVRDGKKPVKKIGPNGVAVPAYFYKVLLAKYRDRYYAVGFLVPNTDDADIDFKRYVFPIDHIEKVTGNDFFPALPDSIERAAEKQVDRQFWF